MKVLSVNNLDVSLRSEEDYVHIVRGISFSIEKSGFFCLVGESGCGKSITAMTLTRLPPTDTARCTGEVVFKGRNILQLAENELREVRGNGGIAYIFQDPMSALNPVLSISTQLREALPRGFSRPAARDRMMELLDMVGLPDGANLLKSFPCELSGGMAQRICIAMAMASEPSVLVADEPSTALDVITQQRVLDLLDAIRKNTDTSIMLITHNLGLVARYGHEMSVMYAGMIIESGTVRSVLSNPRHPYTAGLISSVPGLSGGGIESLGTIPGRVPPPGEWGQGCSFEPRCSFAMPVCMERKPLFEQIDSNHRVACFAHKNMDSSGK